MNVKDINLTPAELQAIIEHQRTMSLAHGMEVSFEQAVEDFTRQCRDKWLHEKQHLDIVAQIQEIEKHKYFRSIEERHDIGRHAASAEWCAKYAHLWRAERESLERNGFLQAKVVLQNENSLHIQPASTVARIARKFTCDVYLHHDKLDYYNFLLQGRKYLNVKSVLGLISVSVVKGDELDIISTGPQAKEALQEIAIFINVAFKPQDIEGVAGIESSVP